MILARRDVKYFNVCRRMIDMKKIIVSMCFYAVALNAQYYSQSGQDRYLNEHLFKGKRQGIFIDVGAHDGIPYSNTYFLYFMRA